MTDLLTMQAGPELDVEIVRLIKVDYIKITEDIYTTGRPLIAIWGGVPDFPFRPSSDMTDAMVVYRASANSMRLYNLSDRWFCTVDGTFCVEAETPELAICRACITKKLAEAK